MWRIREATEEDAAALAALAERTFRQTFALDNTAADMDAYCAENFSPQIQRREIAGGAMTTVVAEAAGRLAAYAQLAFGPPPAAAGPGPAMEVRRFYVDAAWHGRGLAAALMAAAREAARARGIRRIWLGVWERNFRAIRFYEKCGLSVVGDKVFVLGSDPQRDLVMAGEVPVREET